MLAYQGRPVQIGNRKAQALLAYVALSPNQWATREQAAGLLWSDVSESHDAVFQEPRLEVVEHVRHSGTAHDALFARLADLLKNVWQAKRVVVDATGLGETMARLLAGALER